MSKPRGLPGRPSHPFFQQEYEHQLEMVRPSLIGTLDVPPVPTGYVLRQLRDGEKRQYDALFHLAFEDEGRYPEILERTLDGGFFVVEHLASRELVASCLAMRGSSSPRHLEAGQLGWLVTDPSHMRKGLGTIVSACATNRLAAEGYARPFLGTEDLRLPAIAIYLKLGWHPYIYRREMESRWRSIFTGLGREFEPCPNDV
jgi:GNAT superfamily N-acetyltransferase